MPGQIHKNINFIVVCLYVLGSYAVVTGMGCIEILVKAAYHWMSRLFHLMSEYARQLFGKCNLFYTVVVVKCRKSCPANVEAGINILFRPFKNECNGYDT